MADQVTRRRFQVQVREEAVYEGWVLAADLVAAGDDIQFTTMCVEERTAEILP